MNDARTRADGCRRYRRKRITQMNFALNKTADADVIEWLTVGGGSKVERLRRAVRAAIEAERRAEP